MAAALTSGCYQNRGEDWANAAWRTRAALAEDATCLALEGWPERHTSQSEHSTNTQQNILYSAVAAQSVATHIGTACKLCYDEDDVQGNQCNV